MTTKPIDLDNIDKETTLLYSGVVNFDTGSWASHPPEKIISVNETLAILFANLLLRRIVRPIKQFPEHIKDMIIEVHIDGITYKWEKDGKQYLIHSIDSNQLPDTVSIGCDNYLLTLDYRDIKLRPDHGIKSITVEHRAFKDIGEWRHFRGQKNTTPYNATANLANFINLAVDTERPFLNFQTVETMVIMDVQPNSFKIGFDILGRLYMVTVETQ